MSDNAPAFIPADHDAPRTAIQAALEIVSRERDEAHARIKLLEKTIAIQVKEIDRLVAAVQDARHYYESLTRAKLATAQAKTK